LKAGHHVLVASEESLGALSTQLAQPAQGLGLAPDPADPVPLNLPDWILMRARPRALVAQDTPKTPPKRPQIPNHSVSV